MQEHGGTGGGCGLSCLPEKMPQPCAQGIVQQRVGFNPGAQGHKEIDQERGADGAAKAQPNQRGLVIGEVAVHHAQTQQREQDHRNQRQLAGDFVDGVEHRFVLAIHPAHRTAQQHQQNQRGDQQPGGNAAEDITLPIQGVAEEIELAILVVVGHILQQVAGDGVGGVHSGIGQGIIARPVKARLGFLVFIGIVTAIIGKAQGLHGVGIRLNAGNLLGGAGFDRGKLVVALTVGIERAVAVEQLGVDGVNIPGGRFGGGIAKAAAEIRHTVFPVVGGEHGGIAAIFGDGPEQIGIVAGENAAAVVGRPGVGWVTGVKVAVHDHIGVPGQAIRHQTIIQCRLAGKAAIPRYHQGENSEEQSRSQQENA